MYSELGGEGCLVMSFSFALFWARLSFYAVCNGQHLQPGEEEQVSRRATATLCLCAFECGGPAQRSAHYS